MLTHRHVRSMACRLRPTVHCKMFRRRNDTIVFWIVALHARNKCDSHSPREERIFAISFLSAPPARITEDVDVRRPEVETLENIAMPCTYGLDVLDSSFGPDGNCHPVNRIQIECCSQSDWLRKLGDTGPLHSMQRLAPPVISWNIQPRHRTGLIHELRDLFFHGHA